MKLKNVQWLGLGCTAGKLSPRFNSIPQFFSCFRLSDPNMVGERKELNKVNQIYKLWMSLKEVSFSPFSSSWLTSHAAASLCPIFSDREQSLLCAMAMTPERGVMMRFWDCWGLWWDRLWMFVKVLTGGKPPPETEICWRERNKSHVSEIGTVKSSVQNYIT